MNAMTTHKIQEKS